MAYFPTKVLDNQIKALPTVGTASGSIATFDTDMAEDLIEVVCDIQYSQASGTPSPSNPLPITTYTSLNLSHSGADISNPTITNIPFGRNVAKGVLNVTSGVLTIEWRYIDLSVQTWAEWIGITDGYKCFPDNMEYPTDYAGRKTGFICNCYPPSTGISLNDTMDNQSLLRYNGQLVLKDTNITSLSDIPTALSGVYLAYAVATPERIALTPTQIQALLNENNIWCDTGDTSVKFILSVGKYVNQNT